ncbi:MAG: glutamate-binding protein [Amycolatopsis sp.]|jgi:glutamate transport system substrate-binding protein|uniref:glutamate ABC transporter substrate-binding protein n=1 Tax=Amycolatopsis sp. TaxID=37632 RepID=UPI00262843A5|nr:glutamate ABC transporter substrate-binding protein [Amycolatopsis sp.]MCU1680740.1 glutamate-binding protein [Amycolatopsis sp.]
MRLSRVLRVSAVVVAAGLALAACGGGSSTSGSSGSTNVVSKAKNDKKLTIGIKFDQPGLGLKTADGKYVGFDVDVATYIAKQLGVDASGITWKEAQSAQREDLIKKGDVDFIVASYSITDARKKVVSFAGPYFVAAQDLLVRQDNTDITGPESLTGNKKLCSVKGSTPAQNIQKKYAQKVQLLERAKYTDCVTSLLSGEVDAMTTDNVILAGYAAQYPGKLKLVGKGFTTENYGVGFKLGDTETQTAINAAITKMESDGSWEASLKTNVGPSGFTIPAVPAITEK